MALYTIYTIYYILYLLIKVKSHIQNMIMKVRTFDKREKCNASSSDKYILKSSK